MRIKNPDERSFYEIEATKGTWSKRVLQRQYSSSLYERLLLSSDKSKVMELSTQGIVVQKPEDIVKDPMVLEFLGFPAQAVYSETELETRLLNPSSDGLKKDGIVITGAAADGGGGAQNASETVDDGSCRDYDDFFSRTRYTVPEGVLDENGRMERFNNDLVIRYLDKVVVRDDGYVVVFKAGVKVEVEV